MKDIVSERLGIEQPDINPTTGAPQETRGYSISGVMLRGYEVAKLVKTKNGDEWEPVGKGKAYRPNEWGYKAALAEATWWHENHPNLIIRLRPVISIDPGTLRAGPEHITPPSSVAESSSDGHT